MHIILNDELVNDPLVRGYTSMSSQAAADSLNLTIDRSIDVRIPMRDLTTYLATVNKLEPIDDRSKNPGAAHDECFSFMFSVDNPNYDDMDINNTDTLTMLQAIKAAGFLDNADVTVIQAMGQKDVNRAEELTLGKVEPGHVEGERA